MEKYIFWIRFDCGTEVYNKGLTKRQAVTQYNKLYRKNPTNIKRFGWKLEKNYAKI